MDLFLRTQERVRNSRGKRAIRVRATEFYCIYNNLKQIVTIVTGSYKITNA